MRIPLRQEPRYRSQMGYTVNRMRGRKQARRARICAFDVVGTKMLVEPCAPYCTHAVAGLEPGSHAGPRSAAHETEMAAVITRQQFDDGAGFAMPPHPQHDPFVGPFHAMR